MKYIKHYEQQNFKINDIVVCVNNTGMEESLTLNKKYSIIDIESPFFHIIGDENILCNFVTNRFVSEIEYDTNKYNL